MHYRQVKRFLKWRDIFILFYDAQKLKIALHIFSLNAMQELFHVLCINQIQVLDVEPFYFPTPIFVAVVCTLFACTDFPH
jgi:hypothetical protein